jgi:hypothetical protein
MYRRRPDQGNLLILGVLVARQGSLAHKRFGRAGATIVTADETGQLDFYSTTAVRSTSLEDAAWSELDVPEILEEAS